MLLLHASIIDHRLLIWAEKQSSSRHVRTGKGPKPHTHCAKASEITTALSLPARFCTSDSGIIWLPGRGSNPLPSNRIIGDPTKGRGGVKLLPWQVDGVSPTLGGLLKLKKKFHTWPEPPEPGLLAGPSLLYTFHLLDFVFSLAIRQQFLPSISKGDKASLPIWEAVY
ncbi:MAG: hypothetical protein JJU11_15745, partial [Candidatus Sumerlaeia bacterium]|nr:hypothetical protein [Candidatus Sumerlaeia bacterium]